MTSLKHCVEFKERRDNEYSLNSSFLETKKKTGSHLFTEALLDRVDNWMGVHLGNLPSFAPCRISKAGVAVINDASHLYYKICCMWGQFQSIPT